MIFSPLLIAVFALTLAGCRSYLAFSTGTTFGLDISQDADQTVDVVMGYQRAEVASIPVPKDTDASTDKDSYSVLGSFYVNYGNPFTGMFTSSQQGLTIRQQFATGLAARYSAESIMAGTQTLGSIIKKFKEDTKSQ